MLWPYVHKSRLQDILQRFYVNYPKNSLSREFRISIQNKVSFDLLLFMLEIETSTPGTNSMPFLIFRRDHLRSSLGIISGLGIICGRGSFAALYNTTKEISLKQSSILDSEINVLFFSFKRAW